MRDKNTRLALAGFILLMMSLGASDSMRGIFSPIFSEHFQLSASQLSRMITISYLGNLAFLMLGGRMVDRMDRKKSLIGFILLWMAALLLFILTDNYPCLLFGMFLSMGCSTLLNTTVNLYTSILFAASPGMVVNFLFFTQGIGTSGSQSLVGNLATGFSSWRMVCLFLFAAGGITALILSRCGLPDFRQSGGERGKMGGIRAVASTPAFPFLVLIFACYFVAEHGIMNWLVVYANHGLGIPMGRASNYTAVFFGGIMLGRLAFSPLVDRLGIFRSMRIAATLAAALFVSGSVMGGDALWVLSASGLFFSILYPTLVMCIGRFYPHSILSSASGLIISAASLGDIGFNAVFGGIADHVGYQKAFLILPGAMAVFTVLMWWFSLWADKSVMETSKGVNEDSQT